MKHQYKFANKDNIELYTTIETVDAIAPFLETKFLVKNKKIACGLNGCNSFAKVEILYKGDNYLFLCDPCYEIRKVWVFYINELNFGIDYFQ